MIQAKTLKSLFRYKSRWTKFFGAVDKNGNAINSKNEKACKWCLYGGINKVYGIESSGEIENKLLKAICKLFPKRSRGFISFNDHPLTTFKDLRMVLEEANV